MKTPTPKNPDEIEAAFAKLGRWLTNEYVGENGLMLDEFDVLSGMHAAGLCQVSLVHDDVSLLLCDEVLAALDADHEAMQDMQARIDATKPLMFAAA